MEEQHHAIPFDLSIVKRGVMEFTTTQQLGRAEMGLRQVDLLTNKLYQ